MSTSSTTTTKIGPREITFAQAINEALAEEMRRDPTVFIIGEMLPRRGRRSKFCRGW
jgi:pyruvate dehydrogenase E1 component beta subunit